jgi:hypothetical protein
VFLLYDVLTPEECQQYIDLTEKMGYEEATVTTFGGMVSMPGTCTHHQPPESSLITSMMACSTR